MVDGEPTGPETADIVVTPPQVGVFEHYRIKLCVKNTVPANCREEECRPVNPYPTPTTCPFTNLLDDTTYTVEAWAVTADNVDSPVSNTDQFSTPKYRQAGACRRA